MNLEQQKERASQWFRQLRDELCSTFETLEAEYTPGLNPPAQFERKTWERTGGGGGETSLMRGRLFEKIGVNISVVNGTLSEEFRKNIPGTSDDPTFFAAGISVVAHPLSPLVPIVHMNTRFIVTTKSWFGGGADLTPTFPNDEDTRAFHATFKTTCDRHDPTYYPRFKAWCDEYFHLPHRREPRGVGGIFYDDFNTGNWENDFAFTQDVGRTFCDVYPVIVRRRMGEVWTREQREALLVKRGRYVEFNLLYDRGTKFGLMTGGNTEAILMSLPPEASWK